MRRPRSNKTSRVCETCPSCTILKSSKSNRCNTPHRPKMLPTQCVKVILWWQVSIKVWGIKINLIRSRLLLRDLPSLAIREFARIMMEKRSKSKTCHRILVKTSGAKSKSLVRNSTRSSRKSRSRHTRTRESRWSKFSINKFSLESSCEKKLRRRMMILTGSLLRMPRKSLRKRINRRWIFRPKSLNRRRWEISC